MPGLIARIVAFLASLISKGKGIIAWTAAGTWVLQFFIEIVKKVLGIIGIGTAVTTGALNFVQVKKLLGAIGDPQGYLLDYISSALDKLPITLSSLVADLDSMMVSFTSDYFTPPITFTYLLQVTAVGECFNQLLMSAIQNSIFIFSIYLIRWAFTNNVSYTQTPPQTPKGV